MKQSNNKHNKKQAINVQKEIERRAKLFKGASLAEKRVLIAKDVINQIETTKRFKPQSQIFVKLSAIDRLDSEDNIQEKFFDGTLRDCHCCVLGSMMMSCTLFNNKEKAGNYYSHFTRLGDCIENGDSFNNQFDKIFTSNQLKLIEQCFEGGNGFFGSDYANDYAGGNDLLSSYRIKFKSNRAILIAIMKNI